jgi:hypothetical protein
MMKIISKILVIVGIMSVATSISYASQAVIVMNQNPTATPGYVVPNASAYASGIPTFPYSGIRIQSNNNYTSKVKINSVIEGHCIPFTLTESEVTGGGIMDFTHTLMNNPEHVCVHVYGETSLFGVGGWTKVTNNNGCVITINNKGMMRGITLNYNANCQVGGANAPAERGG